MATAKKTSKPRRAPRRKPASEPPTEPETPETPQQQAKGVFVAKGLADDGKTIGVEVHAVGVEPTEVQTLLEMGIANFRQTNGLPPLK